MKVTIQDSKTSVTVQPRDFKVTVSGARGPQGPQGDPGQGGEWGTIVGDITEQTDLYNALQAKVPYTGATQDVNLGEYGAQLGNLEFDNTPTNVPTTAGSVYWNDTDGTLNIVLKGGQTISRVGETQHIRALNNTGAEIARGKVVYVLGAQGQRLTIALADADTEILSKDTIGFTAEAIADGAEGFVIVQGVINNINTTGMTDGATVYLSQTAGSYTTTPPSDPAHLVILGFIVNGGSTGAGSIYVKVDNGYELEELHNVSNSAKTTPVADDALLLRDSADNNLWKRLTWTNALAGVKSHMDTFKSVAGGYASLDGSGKVPASELPSYVDDVVEVANYAALPGTGETGKIYVTLDTNKCYRWSGSVYVEVSSGGGIDTLTTTGTSGAATLVGSTLNIPQYQGVLTNPVTGTGTAGQVAYFNGTSAVTGSSGLTYSANALSVTGIYLRVLYSLTANSTWIEFPNAVHRIYFTINGNEAARFDSSRNFLIGNTDGTGRLTVRGSGTTSATTALLVQNSTPSELFKITDDSVVTLGNGTTSTLITNSATLGNSKVLEIKSTGNISTMLDIRPSGTSSDLTGFYLRDSETNASNSNIMIVGRGNATLPSTGVSYVGNIVSQNTTANSFHLGFLLSNPTNARFEAVRMWNTGNVLIQSGGTYTDTSAKFTVRGSGTTSATTALLVQNSTPTNLFQITDNGVATLTPTTLTGSEATSALDISQTWNTTGTPTLIKANVTNTASNANSALMALQTGGVNRFAVYRDGSAISSVGYFVAASSIGFQSIGTTGTSSQNVYNVDGTISRTAGVQSLYNASITFNPTSGTATYNSFVTNPTINQTGGANGITRGLYVNPTLTAAADWRSVEFSNNTGWGLYGAGTANNYLGGGLGIGSTAVTGYSLHLGKPMTGGVTTFGIMNEGQIQSDSTTSARYFMSFANTQAASFTVGNLFHYIASQGTFGLNSTVTAQYGFFAASQLSGATNNYGFYGDIASGTGRWNLYMNGTAANYLAGNTSIGTTTSSGRLTVQGSGTTSATKAFVVNNSTPTAIFEVLDNGRINQTIPGASTNTLFGTDAGANASLSNNNHTAFGRQALFSTTTAANCTAIGREALYNSNAGDSTAIGYRALYANVSGFGNTAIGAAALASITSGNNVGIGRNAGSNLVSSVNNTVIGFNAARFLADGSTALTTANNSVFLGLDTRAAADSQTNQIVIGYQAIGNGSNTATLGDTSITATYLRGNINYTDGGNFVFGTTTGTKIGTSTSQKIGLWNATPIVQPTTAVAAATRVGGGGTTVTDTDTFDGYTIAQLVKALRNMGALA